MLLPALPHLGAYAAAPDYSPRARLRLAPKAAKTPVKTAKRTRVIAPRRAAPKAARTPVKTVRRTRVAAPRRTAPEPAPSAWPRPARLEPTALVIDPAAGVRLSRLPNLDFRFAGRAAGLGAHRELIFYSLSPELQSLAEELVRNTRAPHAAAVVMEPRTGRILALSQKSVSLPNAALHAGFPAASLFKLVTSAAALDRNRVGPFTKVNYSGGIYTLNRYNYRPDAKRDRRSMTIAEGLGRSCNPVFARVALEQLDTSALRLYTRFFGFNADLRFSAPLAPSAAHVPLDQYELARTAAGFGKVYISAVHAAALMSGIANEGRLPRPQLVDHVLNQNGTLLYRSKPVMLQRMMRPTTARTLLRMMQFTTTVGTARAYFMPRGRPALPGIAVAAKTGTLSGVNPKGLNRWFLAAAPIENPKIAVAVIVVNPGNAASRPGYLGRALIQRYLRG